MLSMPIHLVITIIAAHHVARDGAKISQEQRLQHLKRFSQFSQLPQLHNYYTTAAPQEDRI
jgi:hypothetical protein